MASSTDHRTIEAAAWSGVAGSADTYLGSGMFFIVGCPRSGTTLLQSLLDTHQSIAVSPETHFVRRLWLERHKHAPITDPQGWTSAVHRMLDDPLLDVMGVTPADVFANDASVDRTYRDLFALVMRLFAENCGATIVGEKTPNHVLYTPLLRQWFPQARFLSIVRDPLPVVASWKGVPWSTGSVLGDARVWVRYAKAELQDASSPAAHDSNRMRVRYEELVENPEQVLLRIMDFLGVEPEAGMVATDRWTATIDPVAEPWKASSQGVIAPARSAQLVESLSFRERTTIRAVTRQTAARLGYLSPWPSPVEVGVSAAFALRRWVSAVRNKRGRVRSRWSGVEEDRNGRNTAPVVAFVHMGDSLHGVHRYGRELASAVAVAHDVVEESSVQDTGNGSVNAPAAFWSCVVAVWRARRRAQVIHVQYQAAIWGRGFGPVLRVLAIRLASWRRVLVATVHDVYPPPAESGKITRARRVLSRNALALRLLCASADKVIVSSKGEALALGEWARGTRPHVVPLVVPRARTARDKQERSGPARLAIAGYIHPRKGYEIAIRAAACGGPPVELDFIGGAVDDGYAEKLMRLSHDMGVKVNITGYLDDEAFERKMRRVTLAICPYHRIAASASMATLIAQQVPMVAYANPYAADLAAIVPGAIRLYAPNDERSLRGAINAALAESLDQQRAHLAKLAAHLSPEATTQRHAEIYYEAVGRRFGSTDRG